MSGETNNMSNSQSDAQRALMFTSISKKDLERICNDSMKLLLEFDTSQEIVFEEI